jgi:hypothetical protein
MFIWITHITTGDLCSIGNYCPNSLSSPNLCPDSICMFISVTDSTTGDICPIGNFCPNGSSSPNPCPDSTYMENEGASVCLSCPQGYYCTAGSQADPCPQGYYCPPGTGSGYIPCPIGKFRACMLRLRFDFWKWKYK